MLPVRILAVATIVTFSESTGFGAQIRVPADQPAIQQAINLAVSNDVVLVAPGAYHETINFKGKAILVESEAGAQATIIDGGGTNSVATFSSGEGAASVLRGFTLQNGMGSDGGGVFIANCSPTILSNIITGNFACGDGAGIAIRFGSPLVQWNVIANNRQTGCSGGGGGGISLGGAASAQILNNVITNNSHDSSGGGIDLFAAGTPLIRDNYISGNTAGTEGGAISMFNYADALIINNLIIGNRASQGGGIYWLVPSGRTGPLLVNNTIVDNNGATGSGIYADGFDAKVQLLNNIIVAPSNQTAFYCGAFDASIPALTNNDVLSASGSAYGGISPSMTGINGNISVDPLFHDPEIGDYHLRRASPVIDAGSNTGAATDDLDFVVRPIDGNTDGTATVDIGAYEYVPGPPRRPARLVAISGDRMINLSWRTSADATSYNVKRSGTPGGPYALLRNTTGTNALDTTVVNETFYYYVVTALNDKGEGPNSAEVAVKAGNFPPVAANDLATGLEDTTMLMDVLANDSDPNHDSLSILSANQALNGFVSITNNRVAFTPAPNFNGTNSFIYVVTDGRAAMATGLVTVVITPVNDPPFVFSRSLVLTGDLTVSFSLIATDIDSSVLSYQIATGPTNGLLSNFNPASGSITYTPAHAYVGRDTFTFVANDGQSNSAPATVIITVRAPRDADADGLPDYWETLYGGGLNPNDDLDSDGLTNYQEYLGNTNPKNSEAPSGIRLRVRLDNGRPLLSWNSIGGTRYRVQTSDPDGNGGFTGVFNDLPRPASAEIDPGPAAGSSTMTFVDDRPLPLARARWYRIKVVNH